VPSGPLPEIGEETKASNAPLQTDKRERLLAASAFSRAIEKRVGDAAMIIGVNEKTIAKIGAAFAASRVPFIGIKVMNLRGSKIEPAKNQLNELEEIPIPKAQIITTIRNAELGIYSVPDSAIADTIAAVLGWLNTPRLSGVRPSWFVKKDRISNPPKQMTMLFLRNIKSEFSPYFTIIKIRIDRINNFEEAESQTSFLKVKASNREKKNKARYRIGSNFRAITWLNFLFEI
jgi:hypothetical protein